MRPIGSKRCAGKECTRPSTHLLVHAAARALSSNRQLNQIVAGNRRQSPVSRGYWIVDCRRVVRRAGAGDRAGRGEERRRHRSRDCHTRPGDSAGRSADAANAPPMGAARSVRVHAARVAAGAVHERHVQTEGCRDVSSVDRPSRLGALLDIQCLRPPDWRADATAGRRHRRPSGGAFDDDSDAVWRSRGVGRARRCSNVSGCEIGARRRRQ